uniref:Putative structural protein n=1 Tax=viral metagenome TaxID=1070528 RepID=A0A6M3LQ83_9ZZZZ
MEETKIESIEEEARRLVNVDRQDTYGPPEENLLMIARLWTLYLASQIKSGISAKQVAEMMILLKLARNVSGLPRRDNYIDMIGYTIIAERLGCQQVKTND